MDSFIWDYRGHILLHRWTWKWGRNLWNIKSFSFIAFFFTWIPKAVSSTQLQTARPKTLTSSRELLFLWNQQRCKMKCFIFYAVRKNSLWTTQWISNSVWKKKIPLSGDMYQFLESFLAAITEFGGAPLASSGYRLYLLWILKHTWWLPPHRKTQFKGR